MAVGDVDLVVDIHVRGWRHAYHGHLPEEVLDNLDRRHRTEGWTQRVRQPGPGRAWVAEVDGTVAGFAYTGPGRDADLPDDAGEVYALYLEPGVIGTGVGRVLFARAVADLDDRGFHPIVVWVHWENERARRFYEKAGFRLDGGEKVEDYEGAPMPEARYRLV